jgi:hypothetical protein
MKKIYSLLLLAGLFLFGAQNVMANYYVTHNANLPTGGNAWTLQQTQDLMTEDNGVYFLIVSKPAFKEVMLNAFFLQAWSSEPNIYFSLNGIPLGKWISPGDFGARRGMFSPHWWPDALNQYGLLKTLIINKNGTFIDGNSKISSTTISDLNIDYNSSIELKFEVPKDTANCGGLTLFGSTFGDYNQDIVVKLYYTEDQ